MDSASVVAVSNILHLQCIEAGMHVTRRGQPANEMVVLLTGSAVLLDESHASVQRGHGEPCLPLYSVHPGAVFGERCALGLDDKFHATVRPRGRGGRNQGGRLLGKHASHALSHAQFFFFDRPSTI